VTLAALIAAYHEAETPGGGLRATLPLAGRTLLERQVQLAAQAGANLIVVAVERVPADLLGAIDRLKAQGLPIAVARTAEEAAEAVHTGDRLLLIGDGLVPTQTHINRLLAHGPHSVLTVPDARVDDRFERIDSESRWGGLALFDGEMLKRTAAMLGEWDLQSTLLRRALQGGARHLSVRGEPIDEQLTVAERPEDLEQLQQRIFDSASAHRPDWVSRYLLAPVEQAATRYLMPTAASPSNLGMAELALTALGALAFFKDWLWIGLPMLLLATLVGGTGERLALLRMQDAEEPGWWEALLPFLSAAALGGLAFSLSETRSWGCLALAGTVIAFMAALKIEMAGREIPGSVWLAERKGLAWLMLPFAATGLWATGLAALATYAGGSFFWAQRNAHQRISAPPQD
jgi:hypothetical protein